MRIAVVGAGSVGGVFAAHLSTVHDVVACVRRPFDTWQIDSEELPYTGPAVAVTSPEALASTDPVDVVFVGLKSQHNEAAAGWFDVLCGPDTTVVAMQNGIEAEERLGPLVGGATVVAAVVYCGAELVGPGHVKHTARALLIVPDDEVGQSLTGLADGTPLTIDASASWARARWIKLGLNSAANGLTALTGRSTEVMGEPGVGEIAKDLLRECWTIGRAAGVDLDLDGIDALVDAMSTTNATRTSMQQDREAGRPTEHDAIHGAVLRMGERHGIATPVTSIVHALLAAQTNNQPS